MTSLPPRDAGRMNTPGTDGGNRSWAAPPGAFDGELAARLRALVEETGRRG